MKHQKPMIRKRPIILEETEDEKEKFIEKFGKPIMREVKNDTEMVE